MNSSAKCALLLFLASLYFKANFALVFFYLRRYDRKSKSYQSSFLLFLNSLLLSLFRLFSDILIFSDIVIGPIFLKIDKYIKQEGQRLTVNNIA